MGGRSLAVAAVFVLVAAGLAAWVLTRPVHEIAPIRTGPGTPDDPTSVVREAPESSPPAAAAVPADSLEPAIPRAAVEGSHPAPVDLAAADRDLDLFGIVVNEADEPVAGCDLETFFFPPDRFLTMNFEDFKKSTPGPRTKSAEDGTFSLRLEWAQAADLKASAPGYAVTVLSQVNAGERARVVLSEAARLRVEVLDAEESPVEGAEIEMWLTLGSELMFGDTDRREGVTDGMGLLEISDLHPGSGWMWIRRDEMASATEQFKLQKGELTELKVTLGKGRVVTGKVTDKETGDPVSGAKVAPWMGASDFAVADESGRYEIRGGADQFFMQLTVLAMGYASKSKMITAEGDLDFQLEKGLSASGLVVDAKGEPLGEVLVSATGFNWEGGGQEQDAVSTHSAGDGTFTLGGLHKSIKHTVSLFKRGYGRLSLRVDHEDAVDGKTDLGALTLTGPQSIEGYVLSASGEAVTRASVSIAPPAPAGENRLASLGGWGQIDVRKSDDLGRFRFPRIAPGVYTLTLSIPGTAESRKTVTLPEGSDLLDVELRAEAGRTLTVLVVDDSGSPLQGMYVYTWSMGNTAEMVNTTTDEEGTAVLQGLGEGEVTVGVASMDQEYIAPEAETVTPSGQELRFVLKKGAQIKGVVKGPGDKPIPRLNVMAEYDEDGDVAFFGTTGLDGSFTIQVPPGVVADLHVEGSPWSWGEEKPKAGVLYYTGEVKGVTAPAEDIVLRVEVVALDRTLTVLVLSPEGKPVPGATVYATAVGMVYQEEMPTTGDDGRVRLEGLPPTEVSVTVMASPGMDLLEDANLSETIDVIPNGQEVTVRFSKGLAIAGVVVDEAGEAVHGVVVMAGPMGQPAGHAVTDEKGQFRIIVPEAGAYRLQAQRYDEAGPGASTVLDAVNAPSEEVTLVLGSE